MDNSNFLFHWWTDPTDRNETLQVPKFAQGEGENVASMHLWVVAFLSAISMSKNRLIFAEIFYLTKCCSKYSMNPFKATYVSFSCWYDSGWKIFKNAPIIINFDFYTSMRKKTKRNLFLSSNGTFDSRRQRVDSIARIPT
jgi:hypothetical protein